MGAPTTAGTASVPGTSADEGSPSTFAAFSPTSSTSSALYGARRTTILIHQKSPLLVATPPQVTRALAYSHPFLLPLSRLVGLISWTTGNPWESFLLLAGFWIAVLYGDAILVYAGPLIFVGSLMLAMYSRHYSPLSSTTWDSSKSSSGTGAAIDDEPPGASVRHQKSLDEIVENLKLLTSRCNILLDPWLRLTDFLSRPQSATRATTRQSLLAICVRLALLTPVWAALSLPPARLLTARRVVLVVGTITLSWHSRPARVIRAVLWRSAVVRQTASALVGLDLTGAMTARAGTLPPRGARTANDIAKALEARRKGLASAGADAADGIRFTYAIWENQRRWIGIGWTASLLAYERAAWTDEQLNPVESKDSFRLPDVDGGIAEWRWVVGSDWRVDGEGDGWTYFDNKWHDPKKGADSWGKYTRKRKWVRDAELVEISQSKGKDTQGVATGVEQVATPSTPVKRSSWFSRSGSATASAKKKGAEVAGAVKGVAIPGAKERKGKKEDGSANKLSSSVTTEDGDDGYVPLAYRGRQTGAEADWGIGEDAGIQLG